MVLDMNAATYGRDTAGQKKLLTNLLGDIDKAIKALGDTSIVTNEVDKYWLGSDANQFVKSFKGSASELQNLFKKFKTMIETALNNDSKQFSKMQTTNANTITQNINKIK